MVVYRKAAREAGEELEIIPSDRVAVVIEICDDLNEERLSEAYSRVAEVKHLAKTPVPKGETRSNITLGIVLAANSSAPLDRLADKLYRINCATPHKQWLDMIVVASVGVINYAIQFPGESLSGDLLPPAEGAFASPAPPAFYVTIVMRPIGVGSFGKMVAFMVGHLVFFAPDVAGKQLDWSPMMEGQSNNVITTLGFQPSVQGGFVPVPTEGYTGKFIPNKPVHLEGPHGEVLAALQFMKWHTGGVVLMAGKLPLEGLLVFLPNFKPEYTRVIRRPTHQISPVLPITQVEFGQLISNIQQRTNFRIRKETGGIVMEKFLDEGASSPFIARCTLGLLRIRENVLTDLSRRNDFDKRFESTFSSLLTARAASNDLRELWARHREQVVSGAAAQIEGGNVRILENINKQLSESFESFLNASARAVKTGVQGLCTFMGIDIGFLFRKQSAFEAGIERLRRADAPLSNYLVETRKWTERLLLLRNDLEHEIWEFPKVRYSVENNEVHATEPKISDENVTVVVEFLLDRTLCFFEEMVAYVLKTHLPAEITLTEIALAQRDIEAPERFRITPANGGEPPWTLSYHASRFEDT